MSTVSIFRPFSFLAPQEWTVFQAVLSQTSIRISQDSRTQTFIGEFHYAEPDYVGGWVNTIEWRASGALTYRIDSWGADATEIYRYITTPGGTQALYAYLLAGSDVVTATAAQGSVLVGYDGNDRFIVDGARYELIGGPGRDIADYTASTRAVTVDLQTGVASDSTGAGSVSEIENLVGSAQADRLTGSSADNVLDGGAGADTLAGGAGDDSYLLDSAADVIIEAAGGGIDSVTTSVSITLADQVDRLTLTGTADLSGNGNAQANRIQGNAGANRLAGGSGNDTLLGGAGQDTLLGSTGKDRLNGEAGDDTLMGSVGDDEYLVGDGNDTIVEAADEGIDTVRLDGDGLADGAVVTLGANLERLFVEQSTQTATSLQLVGNALDNWLEANFLSQRLDGGAGADTLVGWSGTDVYVVDDVNDVILDLGGSSEERVESTADSYRLPSGARHLTLLGDADIDGIGNSWHNVITGNSGANRLTGGEADTLIGGGGDDTYVLDGSSRSYWTWSVVLTEEAGGGTDTLVASSRFFYQGNHALAAHIENLTLTGDEDTSAVGNDAANVLRGNGRNNRFDGAGGVDTMIGGAGDDEYVVDGEGDVLVEGPGGGTDSVFATSSYTLGTGLERLYLGGASAIAGTGNGLANLLSGNAAANRLDGGAGDDWMYGGAGNDTYVVDRAGDVIGEPENYNGGGVDTVIAAVSYTLGDYSNLENLSLSGIANLDATGNQLANVLTGNAGANRLDGLDGADTMRGGSGDDEYVARGDGDRVIEEIDGGIDHVRSFAGFTLGNHVEHLTLLYGGTGVGNALANRIVDAGPNYGADCRLEGRGGNDTLVGSVWGNDDYANPDTLVGGLGDDRFEVHRSDASVVELADQGHDLVASWSSYVLSVHVEDLVLAGTAAADGTGNASANAITGNDAANVLDGRGGADTLAGAGGDDTYVVGSTGDVVVELAGQGLDTVVSTVDWTLADNIENLRLSGGLRIDGHGNGTANLIEGNAAGNVLDGQAGIDTASYARATAGVIVDLAAGTASGGGGADTLHNFEHVIGSAYADRLAGDTGANRLTGGDGADRFVLNSALASDTLTDFNGGVDSIGLRRSTLGGIGNGNLIVDGSVETAGSGFSSDAELVILSTAIAGTASTITAAAALGSASDAYAAGDRAIFVVNNGIDSTVFLFESAGADATIGSGELTRLAVLTGVVSAGLGDFAWIA